MAATGIAEATERDHVLLSFDMEKFKDCTLHNRQQIGKNLSLPFIVRHFWWSVLENN